MAKILVMDDEPNLRSILTETLKTLGHTIITAEDGRQAVEVAKKENPELALLDIQVPDMDGLAVLKELKKLNPGIKGIMLSGTDDINTAVSAIKQGASDFISKPFKLEEVKAIVTKVLQSAAPAVRLASASEPPKTQTQPQTKTTQKPAAKNKVDLKNPATLKAVAGLSALFVIIIVFVFVKSFLLKPAVREYSIPYTNTTGICWIKPNLWVCDWTSGNIYKHNMDKNLSIASVYKTANAQPTGLTYNGENIFTCSSSEQRIYKYSIDESLTLKTIYSTPKYNPIGLYYDGIYLWVMDNNSPKIYKHRTDNELSIAGVFESPAANPSGMFRDGEYYYIGDYKTARIYKVFAKDFSVSDVFLIEEFADKKYKLACITWDGKNIWACPEETGKIYCISFKNLKPIKF